MRTLRWLHWAAAVATVLVALPAFAYKIQIADHTSLNIDYLLQTQASFVEKGAPDGTAWSKDFFIRRSRILLFGELWKNISFFFETDQANWGKGGKWDAAFFVQDAYVTFKVVDAFMVDVGMVMLPFSRANLQGAIGLTQDVDMDWGFGYAERDVDSPWWGDIKEDKNYISRTYWIGFSSTLF